MSRRLLVNYPEMLKDRRPHASKINNNPPRDHRYSQEGKKTAEPVKKDLTISSRTKIYIPDATIFHHDPDVLLNLKDNHIVTTLSVYDQLDESKKDMGELGSNSRHVSKFLKDTLDNGCNFRNGIKLKTGGKLFLDTEDDIKSLSPLKNHKDTVTNRLLAVALKKKAEFPNNPVIIISNNPSVLIKASAYGIKAEEYKNIQVEPYEGCKEINNRKDLFNILKANHRVSCPPDLKMAPNEFTIIRQGAETVEAMNKNGALQLLTPLREHNNINVFGIKPLDVWQKFALEILINPDIDLVTIIGEAGTGKTLLALAAAFEQTLVSKRYLRIAVARPMVPMGKEMGYLPGTIKEKIDPWMRPIFDSLDRIFWNNKTTERKDIEHKDEQKNDEKKLIKKKKRKQQTIEKCSGNNSTRHMPVWQKYIDSGLLQIEALSLIRGATLPRQFFIIDEAQNLNGGELKTIITRAGEGTKIVLTGDIKQIDSPYLNEKNNGLSITVHRLKDSPLTGHIVLKEVHRSRLAELGVNHL